MLPQLIIDEGPVGLDAEQKKVVDYDGSLMVIAGPGSGKTRVLTERARKYFNRGESTICLCFTRAAAKEMGSRVVGLPATTLHSYCCNYVGWDDKWAYTGLLYRYLQEKDKTLYDNVLIDEVQDLNELEMDAALSMVGKRLFAVGDPYQSIYGFQGAMGPKVQKLLQDYGCEVSALHNNYRSCQQIVWKLNNIYRRGLVSCNIKDTGLSAILCRSNDDVFYVSKTLKAADIPHSVKLAEGIGGLGREYSVLGDNKLILSTIHQSKGREYDNVCIFDWKPYGNQEEFRCYYVACSRASKELVEVKNIERLLQWLKTKV